MQSKLFRKADLIIVAAVILFAGCSLLAYKLAYSGQGRYATVYVDGELTKSCALDEDVTFTVNACIDGEYTIEISNGSVSVTEAPCPDLICAKHAPISRPGEQIICLPGRLVVEIEGDSKKLDGIVR